MVGEDARQTNGGISMGEINANPTMQLATSRDGQPWSCTVYFVIYAGNFYWLSFPERRHSQELALNPQAAITVVLQSVQPVVGVQTEGDVAIVRDVTEAERVLDIYITKYNQGSQFITHFKVGSNKHLLYRFTPRRISLFDERDQTLTRPREVTIT
jgi:uncharacterized protein YhbP (UPF0306 family)